MASSKDDVDVPEYDDDINEFKATQDAASKNRTQKNKQQSSESGKDGSPSSEEDSEDESRKKQEEDDGKRRPKTFTVENGISRRMNGMVHHAQTVGKPEKISSISDYVNQAIKEKLVKDERRLNDGKPFPEPLHMRTGRPVKRRR